jgi:hypothetical protein
MTVGVLTDLSLLIVQLLAAKLGFRVVPTPFAERTALVFAGPKGTDASLQIFDVSGRRVRSAWRGVNGTDMLTHEEKLEPLELAHSTTTRDEFHALKLGSRPVRSAPLDLDRYLEFLTAMSRFQPIPHREAVEYRNVLI